VLVSHTSCHLWKKCTWLELPDRKSAVLLTRYESWESCEMTARRRDVWHHLHSAQCNVWTVRKKNAMSLTSCWALDDNLSNTYHDNITSPFLFLKLDLAAETSYMHWQVLSQPFDKTLLFQKFQSNGNAMSLTPCYLDHSIKDLCIMLCTTLTCYCIVSEVMTLVIISFLPKLLHDKSTHNPAVSYQNQRNC